MKAQEVARWSNELDEVGERLKLEGRFARAEPRQRVLAYMRGLMSEAERKNGWQLAEELGDENPYGVQHLLGRSAWDADQVRDDMRGYVMDHLGAEDGVLIADETGVLKKARSP